MGKLLWFDESESHAMTYYCRHVMDDGRCEPASLVINVLRRDDVKSAISATSLDHMSVALRTACLEPGDLHISDQKGQSPWSHRVKNLLPNVWSLQVTTYHKSLNASRALNTSLT